MGGIHTDCSHLLHGESEALDDQGRGQTQEPRAYTVAWYLFLTLSPIVCHKDL